MATQDDPRISDQQLLERGWQLRMRDSLSRTRGKAQARMEAAGVDPAEWTPLTIAEHLELLQTQRWLEQRLARRQSSVLRALQAGAGWEEIADALGIDVEVVRGHFRVWIAGQQRLHHDIGIGLTDEEAAAAQSLLGATTAYSA